MAKARSEAKLEDEGARSHEMNSPEWWEDYFSGDWLRHDGPGQTRHFLERLVAALPAEDKDTLQRHARTIADWGCAFGEGSAVLASAFPDAQVCGFDASARAIEEASRRHAGLEFMRLAPEKPTGVLPRRFDVVVNSNCLEHFADWQDVLRGNLAGTELLHLSLVPYREQPLSMHHVVSLSEDAFPQTLDGFTRLLAKKVRIDKAFWPSGEQLLVAYASPRYLELREHDDGAHRNERDKWDAYYKDLAPQPVDAPTAAFNEELVGIVRELLPDGGAVLEAGCGGGSQSLAIAQSGFDAALLDFAPAALDYAKRLFAAGQAKADFMLGDAFAPGERKHDLVFNAGVLEHYNLDEQAAFLRGMASRSRQFVLVLIPNRACYWYWLWRIRRTANAAWPFGKEVPQTQLADAFKAAGLHYLGQTFVGEGWTEAFINDCGLDPETREQFLRIHRSPLLPRLSKGYLLAALGSVDPIDHVPARWETSADADERTQAEWTALLADALAGRIAAEQRLASSASVRSELDAVRVELLESQRQLKEASSRAADARRHAEEAGSLKLELQRRLDELNVLSGRLIESQRELNKVSEWASRILAEGREGEARNKELLAQLNDLKRQEEEATKRLQAETQERTRLAAQLEDMQRQRAADQERVSDLEHQLARRSIKNALARARRIAGLAVTDPLEFARRVYLRVPLTPGTRHSVSTLIRRILKKRPGAPMPAAVEPLANFRPAKASESFADVFVFAIIDWHFRIQRPQHLSRELARLGHRVFYLTNHFVDAAEPGFRFEQLDDDGRLFQVSLHVGGAPAIYFAPPAPQAVANILASLSRLLLEVQPQRSIALVEHPYWWEFAQRLPNSTVVYDCMDHHEGFGGMPDELLEIEKAARRDADALVTTSDWLRDRFLQERDRVELIRNACEFDRFAMPPAEAWKDPDGRAVVGYYGAIADWFDLVLLDKLATALPDVCFRLVGSDTARAQSALAHHRNVQFTGERPYQELTHHLYGFDVCLLPFKVVPLTLATNPVKVYEYLAAGRTVVGVDLPELRQFDGLVLTAKDHSDFIVKVRQALGSPPSEDLVARRREFASRQTWRDRAAALSQVFGTAGEPRVSVIVLTYNNLDLTKACLHSLETESDYANLETIVVDNHSTDGSREWLSAWAQGRPNAKLILSDTNTGFAGGNNIGLRAASGEFLVILNNDTYVTRGWIRSMLAHFKRKSKLGLLGPVTNNIGNEAKIEIEYATMADMASKSKRYTLAHPGEAIPLPTAAFFCVMMRRAVYEGVGELCEEYSRGFFEDDDYCRRVERAGWTIECADDVFIHHHLSASFDALGAATKRELFEKNKAIYESKWGGWKPHVYRRRQG